jgi:methylmalonyl-CoA/ethylmalonyl-CoA epimerase
MIQYIYHHTGVATKDIEITSAFYKNIGYSQSQIVIDEIQNVRICFLSKKNSPLVELVEPINDRSPVNEILKKNGNIPYHFCYEVDGMTEAILEMKKSGFIKIINPVPAKAFNNRLICFLYNKDVGLIELLEK